MTHEEQPSSEALEPELDETLPNAWDIPVFDQATDAPVDDEVEDD